MRSTCLLTLLMVPLLATSKPRDTCYVGLYLKNITDLRPDEYAWTGSGWIWFNYHRQGFDPLKNVEVVNHKQVNFSDPYYGLADKQTWLASESYQLTLIHDWQLKNYPFDRQFLQIELEAGLDTSKMLLKVIPGAFKLYDQMNLPGWYIQRNSERAHVVTYDADFGERTLKNHSSYSHITYTIEIRRKSWGLFFKLLIGLYISFFVAYMVFFVSPLRDQRFGLCVGGLFAAIGNKYVMDSNIPASISFSFVDKIHDLTFLFILASLVLSVYSTRIAERRTVVIAERFDRLSAWVLLGIYLVMNLILIISVHYG